MGLLISPFAPIDSPAFTGTPTAPTPATGDNTTKIATTAFATTAIANAIAGVNAGDEVDYTTAAKLPNSPIYNNGVSGVGATITTASLNTALVVDGATPTLNQQILVKNEGDSGGLGATANGMYFVSQVAAVGLAWILTRSLDYNTPSQINSLGLIFTRGGTANAGVSYVLVAKITTIGVDSITYTVGVPAASTIITTSTAAGGDLTGTYPNPTIKANVGLTGTPTAPTQSVGNNTTAIATTAFVLANAAGTSIGLSIMISRASYQL